MPRVLRPACQYIRKPNSQYSQQRYLPYARPSDGLQAEGSTLRLGRSDMATVMRDAIEKASATSISLIIGLDNGSRDLFETAQAIDGSTWKMADIRGRVG